MRKKRNKRDTRSQIVDFRLPKSLKLIIVCLVSAVSITANAQTADPTYAHTGTTMYVFQNDSVSVWGNATNFGSWGSQENSLVWFYGETWKNDNSAVMPGAGEFYFQQPRPAPYANNVSQKLEGGHDWTTSAGASFPDITLENAKDLYLINDDSKTRDTFTFVDGHVIHDKFDFTVGDNDPGEILGYNETQFFVTNGDPTDTEGFLERESLATADAEEAYPIGNSVGDYTPGRLKNDGTDDDFSMRVFQNTYLDGRTGTTFDDKTVARTWDVEERVDGGSNATLELQHNQTGSVAGPATEGSKFTADIARHYITHYVGTAPNGPADGNGVDATSDFKWDVLSAAKKYAGETGMGYITTGANIAKGLVTKRDNLYSFSPYTKTIFSVNTINPIVDYNTTLKNKPVDGSVKTNDQDSEGDNTYVSEIAGTPVPNTGTVTVSTENGSIKIDSLGNYTYTPTTGFTGKDSVVYTLCDDGEPQACEEEILYIDVLPTPDPSDPTTNSTIANPDEGVSYGDTATIYLLANDDDPEKDNQEFAGIIDPNTGNPVTNGTITTLSGVDKEGNQLANVGELTVNPNGTVKFVPVPGFEGTVDQLNYIICDTVSPPYKACDTTTLDIKVFANDPTIDEPPLAGDDYAYTDKNKPVEGNWLRNDSDPNVDEDNDRIGVNGGLDNINPNNPTSSGTVIETLTTEQGGTVEMKDDGTFIYTPPVDYIGPDQVSYEICDTLDVVHCDSATMYFLISPINTDYGDLSPLPTAGAKYLDKDNDGTPDGENSVWSGATITDEITENTNIDGTADGGDDGFVYPTQLDSMEANTFKVDISSVNAGIVAYAQLEIDWNGDGSIDSTYLGKVTTTTSGNDTVVFDKVHTPAGFAGGKVNYRTRVSTDSADLAKAMQSNGEIEGYQILMLTPVPVELITLEGEWDNDNAVITWSTATEVNNSHFIVQRSFTGGDDFESLDVVYSEAIGGNSNSVLNYAYIDHNVKSVTRKEVYYRLIQTDFDGTQEVLGPVVLTVDRVKHAEITIFPVPTKKFVTVQTTDLIRGQEYKMNIVDNLGKIVRIISFTASDSQMDIFINLEGLRSAIYWVTIQGEGLDVTTQKFIKL